MLRKFKMAHFKSVATPLVVNEKLSREEEAKMVDTRVYRIQISNLIYMPTRPDIMLSASSLSRFIHSSNKKHMNAAKRVLRYLRGTINYQILFSKVESEELISFSNSD